MPGLTTISPTRHSLGQVCAFTEYCCVKDHLRDRFEMISRKKSFFCVASRQRRLFPSLAIIMLCTLVPASIFGDQRRAIESE